MDDIEAAEMASAEAEAVNVIKLEAEIDHLRAELAETKIALEAPAKFEIELRNDLSTARAELTRMSEALAYHEHMATEDKAQIEALRNELVAMKRADWKVTHIKDLEAQLTERRDRVDDLDKENEALRKRVGELEARPPQAAAKIITDLIEHHNAKVLDLETLAKRAEERATSALRDANARAEQAEAQLKRAEAERDAMRELVEELADDLSFAVEGRYHGIKDHPAIKHRYNRDMETVVRARAALAPPPAGREG